MTPKLDTYTAYARIFPGILSAIPLFVLWFTLAGMTGWRDLLGFVISLKFLGAISISAVFLYCYSFFIRITSKYFEWKYFTGSNGFPTTYFMYYRNDVYSSDYKDKFRERVKSLLKLDASDATGEALNHQEARKRLDEIFNHIRLKIGNGKLVLKHNIWYGFSRNLIGGAIYAAIFCMLNMLLGQLVFKNPVMVTASATLLAVYALILLFRKAILLQTAESYARQLISEFMATNQRTPKQP